MSGIGNEVQMREIVDQVALAAVKKYAQENPPPRVKAEIPPVLKLAGGLISALLTTGIAAMCLWVVSTLSALQQTVTRIDERQQNTGTTITQRLDKMDDRLTRLETKRTEQQQ